MKPALLLPFCVLLSAACADERPAASPAPATSPAPQQAPPVKVQPLRVDGTRFVRADGTPFEWRGITSFRLLDLEAAGRGGEVDAYLAWTASQRLTIVRVLAMASGLFNLPPERGLAHLQRLLDRAAKHGLYVEVVALASTIDYQMDLAAHVRQVAEICARNANAVLEIANEPYHPAQAPSLHDARYLRSLASGLPAPLLVAHGAGGHPEVHSEGDFITVHFPRGIGWRHVRDLWEGRALLRQYAKPVVNDEPIGAGEAFQPGRRDDSPERFRAAAIASRMIGMGATFHYEDGLHSKIPSGRQLESFNAWREAWALWPEGERVTVSDPGEPGSPVRAVKGGFLRALSAASGGRAWLLAIETTGPVEVTWADGWKPGETRTWAASALHSAERVH